MRHTLTLTLMLTLTLQVSLDEAHAELRKTKQDLKEAIDALHESEKCDAARISHHVELQHGTTNDLDELRAARHEATVALVKKQEEITMKEATWTRERGDRIKADLELRKELAELKHSLDTTAEQPMQNQKEAAVAVQVLAQERQQTEERERVMNAQLDLVALEFRSYPDFTQPWSLGCIVTPTLTLRTLTLDLSDQVVSWRDQASPRG